MAFDGILFYKLGLELKALETGKINKIQEASQNEFYLQLDEIKKTINFLFPFQLIIPVFTLQTNPMIFPESPKALQCY